MSDILLYQLPGVFQEKSHFALCEFWLYFVDTGRLNLYNILVKTDYCFLSYNPGEIPMKKFLAVVLAVCIVFGLAACSTGNNNSNSASNNAGNNTNTANDSNTNEANKSYTIRIYSNSNSPEQVKWLSDKAKTAGFSVSIDDNTIISGDTQAVKTADEKKDGDILFGLNETRWGQVINGTYENLSLVEWTPSWSDQVGNFKFDGKAYGLVVQNILMLYRTDEYGTDGETIRLTHWSDIVDCGYTWYRQGKVGGTTNANINSALLYPYVDPDSEAGGISIEGWKCLWAYCAKGKFTKDNYGFDPLNRGDVQVSTYFSGKLYKDIESAGKNSEHPITNENWKLVDIADGTYYIAEYIGILDRAERTEEQTRQVTEFAEWFGSAEVQAAWAEELGTYPCNEAAASRVYPEVPEIYQIKNFALNKVEGTEMTYAEYVGAHSAEWTNILVNLGYYWADEKDAPEEPDWENLDWETLKQKKQ